MEEIKKRVSYFSSLKQKECDRELHEILSNIKEGLIQKDLILSIQDKCKTGKDYNSDK